MNNIDYLNKISAENHPKKSTGALFSSKPLKIFLIVAAALTLIIFLFGIISKNSHKDKDNVERLYYRLDNLNSVITDYNRYVKSPDLRSAGTSLSTILKSTSQNLSPHLSSYGINPKKSNKSIVSSEADLSAALSTTLRNGQLNGLLDRSYMSEIYYHVSLLITLETTVRDKATNTALQADLTSSIDNLTALLPSFDESLQDTE